MASSGETVPNTTGLAEETKLSLQYAKESSARARSVVLLLTTISVLTFVAWWNHYEHAWPRTRLRRAQIAVHALCNDLQEKLRSKNIESSLDKDCDVERTAQYFSDKDLVVGKAFATRMKFTLSQAKAHLQELQRHYIAGVTKLTVPFLGIQADVNDLGILAGLTLVILLALFCFCIWREEHNVEQLFSTARQNNELPRVYRLYAMTQVFTLPPHEKRKTGRFVTTITSRFIYWLPVLVLGLVAWYDIWITMKYRDEFTTLLDWITIGVEGVVFTIIMLQHRIISKLADRIDRHWYAAYEEITRSGGSWTQAGEPSTRPVEAQPESADSGV